MNDDIKHEIELVEEAVSGKKERLVSHMKETLEDLSLKIKEGSINKKLHMTDTEIKEASDAHFSEALGKYQNEVKDFNQKTKEPFLFSGYYKWLIEKKLDEFLEKFKK